MWSRGGGGAHSGHGGSPDSTFPIAFLRVLQAIRARTRLCATGPALRYRERWGGPSRALSFHVEIDGRVPVRGCDAGVAEPVTDRKMDWTEPLPRRSALYGHCIVGRRSWWAFHGALQGSLRPTADGEDDRKTHPAAVGRGWRRKSTGPALSGTAKGSWRASTGSSRRIQDGRTPPGVVEMINGLHVPVIALGTPPQRATGQRLVAIPIVGGNRAVLFCRWWRA